MNSLGKKLFFLTLIVLITLSCVVVEKVKATDNSFPRKANYFLKWNITDAEAIELAKWDLLVLDMETQIKSKNQLKKIRRLNPDIVMLAYITPQEIAVSAATSDSFMRKKLASGIEERWYLKNDSGENYSFWPGTIMLNVADTCPKVNNKRLNEYVAEFVVEEILSTNLWDGVFYDNAWNNLTWFTGIKADLNRDGLADSFIDNHWVWGMEDLYNLTRSLVGDDIVLVGNAHTRGYKEQLNGKMIESFSSHNWQEVMDNYKYNQELKYEPRYNIINANTIIYYNR